MSTSLQSLATIVLVTITLAFWWHSWRRTRKAGVLAMVKSLAALDLALMIGLTYDWIARVVRVPALPHLFLHLCGVAAAYWLQVFVLYLANPAEAVPDKLRLRRWLLAISMVVLTTCYLLGPLTERLPLITADASDQPFVVTYLAVFEIYLGMAMFDVFWTSRHARHVPRAYLRWGLRLLCWGGLCGLLFAVHKAAYSIADHFNVTPPWPEYGDVGVGRVLTTLAIMLLMAGVTLPSLGPRWELRRHHRALFPLWRDLVTYAPEVVFIHPGRVALVGSRDITDRVRTRVTEIRDVLVGPLQRFLDPEVAGQARSEALRQGLTGESLDTLIEATVIRSALRSARDGQPMPDREPFPLHTGSDYRTEAAWLAQVAIAYTKSCPPDPTGSEPTTPMNEADADRQLDDRTRTNRLARLGTEILAPWVWVLSLPLAVAWDATGHHLGQTLMWGLLVAVTGSIIPMAVIVRGARQGRWDGHHVTNRAGRLVPFLACIGSLAIGAVLLVSGHAPPEMVALAAAMLATLVVSLAVTFGLRFKISVHAAVATGAVVILAATYGGWLAVLAPLVAWVCWSRVELDDHTPAQVLTGVPLGGLVGGVGFWALQLVFA